MAGPPGPARRDDQLGQRGRMGRHRRHGLAADAIDVLLISPERLANERFTTRLLPSIQRLDRPVRRRRGPLHLRLGPRLPAGLPADRPAPARCSTVACRSWRRPPPPTTGSSRTSRTSWASDVRVFRGPLARDTLRLDAIPLADQAERLAWLAEQLPEAAGQRHRLLPDRRRHAAGRDLARGRRGSTPVPYNADLAHRGARGLEDALSRAR